MAGHTFALLLGVVQHLLISLLPCVCLIAVL